MALRVLTMLGGRVWSTFLKTRRRVPTGGPRGAGGAGGAGGARGAGGKAQECVRYHHKVDIRELGRAPSLWSTLHSAADAAKRFVKNTYTSSLRHADKELRENFQVIANERFSASPQFLFAARAFVWPLNCLSITHFYALLI